MAHGLNWSQIRHHYFSCVEQSREGVKEAWDHLTEGYQRVVALSDVAENFQAEATATVGVDPEGGFLDYVDIDPEVLSIYSVHNMTGGNPMYMEPDGMRGREKYLEELEGVETRTKPPTGTARFWVRFGTRVYLRPTPDAAIKIRFRYRLEVPVLTDSTDLTEHPVTPSDLDWAIIFFAAANFFASHPTVDSIGDGTRLKSDDFERKAMKKIASPTSLGSPGGQKAPEEKNIYHQQRLAGYDPNPVSS